MGIRLVGFDLDGTLTRGPTCVQAIATAIGFEESARFEELSMRDVRAVTAAREEMARELAGRPIPSLTRALEGVTLAPGATEAFTLLRHHGIATAIVSITWRFAAEWFAARLGADHVHGTGLDGQMIHHVWPADKGRWLEGLAASLGLKSRSVAAVGDSDTDRELLEAAGLRFFVGTAPPPVPGLIHIPGADLATIARRIVASD